MQGLSLIELLTAVTVAGIVAATALGYYGGVTKERQRWDTAHAILLTIFNAEEVYFNLNGGKDYYPPLGTAFGACSANPAWGCLGPCGADNACKNAWRNIFLDDPNTGGPVVYEVYTPGVDFTALAKYAPRSQGQAIDKDHNSCSPLVCPPVPEPCSLGSHCWLRP